MRANYAALHFPFFILAVCVFARESQLKRTCDAACSTNGNSQMIERDERKIKRESERSKRERELSTPDKTRVIYNALFA